MGTGRVCLLLALGGCSFNPGLGPSKADASVGSGDGQVVMFDAVDVEADAGPDARLCYGTFKNICLTSVPSGDIVVDSPRDFSTDTQCPVVMAQSSGQPGLCIVVAKNFQINSAFRAQGPRVLVLLATESINVAAGGRVDVGSYKTFNGFNYVDDIGAAAASGSTLCGSPSSGQGDNNQPSAGGGGGAGGSFAAGGGDGADGRNGSGGNGGNSSSGTGTMPTFMRGGCRGTNGGSGNSNFVGAGGNGGGAVLAIAGLSITNAGQFRAGGMGGWGGPAESGGGGGGSGGMIVLDAPSINNTGGILNANGGGGAEGGGTQSGGDGGASALDGNGAAVGGSGNTAGGNGGTGSWATTLTGGSGQTAANGGGGGGGAAGVIRIYPAQPIGGTVSPPAT